MIPRPLALSIVCLITLVWVANFGARLFVAGYEPDITINGIFMVLVGSALLASRRKAAGDDDSSDLEQLPEGVEPPPGLEQAQKNAAAYLDTDRPSSRSRHRRGGDAS